MSPDIKILSIEATQTDTMSLDIKIHGIDVTQTDEMSPDIQRGKKGKT